MKIAPLPANEHLRVAALRKYDILDTEPEGAFDSLVELASYICQTPIAAISLIDENRQWFKAITGLKATETSRDVAFCAHAILQDGIMIVPDAQKDERFYDNPLVSGAPDIRFYAGVPLVTAKGFPLGTLCVIDNVARELTSSQLDAIKVLANNIMAHLDLHLSHKQIRQYVADLQLAATIFDASSEAMIVTDLDNNIVTVNPAFTTTTGYTLEEVRGKNPKILQSGKQSPAFYREMWHTLSCSGHWDGEVWNLRKNGEIYAEWLSINVIYNEDGTKRMHVAIFTDITKKKRANELVWRHANYDHLTQLPNRRLFGDRLEQNLKTAHRNRETLGLMFIDLDHFKPINDTHGHHLGDKLLKQAADRINQCVRSVDTVARIGGDEFTVILPKLGDPQHAGKLAGTIIQSLNAPFYIDGLTLEISASIGITLYPKDASDAEQLVKHADAAMYQAKNSGRSRFGYYTKT